MGRRGERALRTAYSNPDIVIPEGEGRGGGSELAAKFEMTWRIIGGPPLTPEYRFHPSRRWRADYCHEGSRVLIELEGGVWGNGRHTRGAGYIGDIEKYNAATMLGYRVLRIPTGGVQPEKLEEIAEFIRRIED
jgi:hypothetical protein